jgi:sensor domain CHASE-containing protein
MNDLDESGFQKHLSVKGWPKVVVSLAGFIAIALGLTVIIGWQAHLPMLVQINPAFAPMQFNTALCILSLGVALGTFGLGKTRTAQLLGTFAAALSGLTLFEYLLNTNLGIDELFFKAYIATQTSNAGRMSPITAICIFQMGLAWVVIGFRRKKKWQPLAVGLLASVVISLCSMAILGYLFDLPRTYGWGQLTRMALHTASGLEVLGLGIFIIAWIEGCENDGRAPRWLPVPVALGTIVASLVLWLALEAKQDLVIAKTTRANAENVQNQINAQLESRLRGLMRMAERWGFSGRPVRATWEDDAANYVRDFPDLQAIEWIDASNLVRWIVPLKGNEAKINANLLREERRGRAAEMAQQQQQPVVTQPVELFHGGTGFVVYAPLFIGKTFDGVIGGVFNVQKIFDDLLPVQNVKGDSIAISESGVKIYERNPSPLPGKQDWIVDSKIELNGTVWKVRVWPTPELTAQLDTSLPKIILVVGLAISFLLSLAVRLTQIARIQVGKITEQAAELKRSNQELRAAAENVKTLSGLLPICGNCKKIRDDNGHWNQIETYVAHHTAASFSHGLCPRCLVKMLEDDGLEVSNKVREAAQKMK